MNSIPLVCNRSPSAVIAYRTGVPTTVQRFLSDARHLAQRLPAGRHVLNSCADRYLFTVGLAACLMTGRITLLPSAQTPEVIQQLASFAADAFCLTDDRRCAVALPLMHYPENLRVVEDPSASKDPHATGFPWAIPLIPSEQLAAIVFTSGSTGTPLPYKKTWGGLVRCVRGGIARLGLGEGPSHTVVGTVPSQHMYGFELTVLPSLVSGHALCAERPFYPADIASAVAALPRPRVLVTTPVHLRALLAAEVAMPPLDLIVSATAPLERDIAREVELKFHTPLQEIYGSTETGQIASRRTAESAVWRLWKDVRLSECNGRVMAQGGHIEQATVLGDIIEITADDAFLLHGRSTDMINIAGKRSSLGFLNAQLHTIPGVIDGVFFLKEAATGPTGVVRLGAAVIAPALRVNDVLGQLRARIDAVFLPRPLLMVDRLPRNAAGKLPQQALQEIMVDMHGSLTIPVNHASFAGHFANFPVLPGAALLDAALAVIERARGIDLLRWRIASAKFLTAVRPGDELRVRHETPREGVISFTISNAHRTVANGTLASGALTDSARDGRA